ncbi:MAG: DUF1232 domain-containing protein [Gammaproteobacteria bacterium]|nr:DUF1232 domain-containing protein [Gammaproteobacteria bacterium]
MVVKVTIELEDADLRHFRRAIKNARRTVRDADEADVISAAEGVIHKVKASDVPDFILDRLQTLELMTVMVRDQEWGLPKAERIRVLSALAYFADPEDIIPDDIPGLGFLDDAIMVELVFRELKHELEAYRDFCAYRENYDNQAKSKTAREQRELRLEAKRHSLHERMQRRKLRDGRHQARSDSIAPLW